MGLITRLRGTLAEKAKLENAVAKADQLEAKLEYVAMMCDVDVDIDEDDSEEDE